MGKTIADLYDQLRQVNRTLTESIAIQREAVQITHRIYERVEEIAEANEPYTPEEFARWREQFEYDVEHSPALDRRSKNALIRAASFEQAYRFFLSHTGELMGLAGWSQVLCLRPQRAAHIPNFGERSIQKLVNHYGG